jgi:uncharacterized protein YbjT (DUF2867 family)
MKIVIVGGSGLIGSKVVTKLRADGLDVAAADHRFPSGPGAEDFLVNTLTGDGLPESIAGASVVVDLSNSPSLEGGAALEFFETSTRTLLAAAAAAGVGHHVALSVVGTEGLAERGSGYLRAKLAQERLIRDGAIPYSIVHATQFFEFVTRIADDATVDGAVRLAPVRFQPMAADDVAAAVVRVAAGAPLNGTVEVAGPERFRFDELVRQGLRARNDPREVVADPHARYFGAELSEDSLVPGAGARLGAIRFADWLRQTGPPGP